MNVLWRFCQLLLAVGLGCVAVLLALSSARGDSRPPPYHVTVQVGQNGRVYHTTCRKLYHRPPIYIFSSCARVRVLP